MIDIEQLRRDVDGFRGRFAFEAEHDPDGNGWPERVNSIVYISDDHEPYAIAEDIDQDVAEPLVRMLNALPELLAIAEAAEKWARRQRNYGADHLAADSRALLAAVDAVRGVKSS